MLKPSSPVTANLIRARELIADQKNWCSEKYENKFGQLCAVGALEKFASTGRSLDIALVPLRQAAQEVHGEWAEPEYVNDNLGHAAVMRMFDRAIELSLVES